MHVPLGVHYLRSLTVKPYGTNDNTASLDFALVINMPDLILRHILPIKFIEVTLYGIVIKTKYVVCYKMAKLIHFVHYK